VKCLEVEKAVITAAGEGSRMLPLTRGIRKEMLPLCAKSSSNGFTLKPIVQLIMEDLYEVGLRSFCFVIRRGEHMIRDYFELKTSYLEYLKKTKRYAEDLENLRRMISNVELEFVYQSVPKGFGDAVLKAKRFVGDDDFVLHAGDGYTLNGSTLLRKLVRVHKKLEASATLVTRVVDDPTKYGVVSGSQEVVKGEKVLVVNHLVEKPRSPPSKFALIAVYAFSPLIMGALENTAPGATGELELTDGITNVLRMGGKVYSIELDEPKSKWLSVGSPEGYLKSLETSRLSVEGSSICANRSEGV
jgi:UTP--glucose-1-phosphate uridylyltransferase